MSDSTEKMIFLTRDYSSKTDFFRLYKSYPFWSIMNPAVLFNLKKGDKHQVLIVVLAILMMVLFCIPAAASRDVKVAVTDLKTTLFTDEEGNPSGFFVDILEDAAVQEGWNIIWVRGSLSESWDRLSSGEIDLLPGVTKTPDREEWYDFSNESALSVWSQVYTRPESGINTIQDLDRKLVAMVRGAASGKAFQEYALKFGVNATYLEKNTPDEVFQAVSTGEADALVVYNTAGQEDSRKYGLSGTPVMFNPSQFGFAVKKGTNQDLLKVLDPHVAKGKNDPSSTYSTAMQRWYGITAEETIPTWIWWGLGGIAGLAALFVLMSYILRREVRRKTAELARQNEELVTEVMNRTRAETDLVKKNEELEAANEQLKAMDTELRNNYLILQKSEDALMQARKKLHLLNTLTFQDIKNAFFVLESYIQLTKETGSIEEAQPFYATEESTLQSIQGKLALAEKYQNLGIHKPMWQNVTYTLITAISHLNLSDISRTIDMPDAEIYADPLLEDVFVALMETIYLQGTEVTRIHLRCCYNAESVTILVESDGPGIADEDKERIFTWEHMGKGGTSLYLAREILSITGISLRETGEMGNGTRFEIQVGKSEFRVCDPDTH